MTNGLFNWLKSRSGLLTIGILLILVIIGVTTWLIAGAGNATTGSGGNTHKQPPPQVALIEITPTGFMPATLSIHTNTDVIWVNEDQMPHLPAADPYPTHSSLPNLVAPRALGYKETYSFLFTKPGTIRYHDDVNPMLSGSVEVR